MIKYFFPLFALILFVASCEKETDYTAVDDAAIQKYLADSNLTATKTASGLYYIIEESGTGEYPLATSMVHVYYKGYLLDGTVFDQTKDNVFARFYLNEVIKGWQEGMMLFKKGAKGKLFIPSELGYGSKAKTDIPANSVLIFEIELLNIYN